ncbi:MAG: hypothetical protein R3301_12320 [Saprospiraceae bacterium]|nr:hypothetical protein [Saprospiraceae bacterium]
MKSWKRFILIGLAVLVALIVWGYLNIWRSPPHYLDETRCAPFEILPMARYHAHVDTHARPFVIQTERVLVYGSEHTRDPADKQLQDLEERFEAFAPTVVLVEGRLGFLTPHVMNPVQRFGEMGKAAALARRYGLPLYSWDPPKSLLLDQLIQEFTGEQLALKEILTPYFSNLRFGRPASPEAFIEDYLDRAGWFGLEDSIRSVADIDRLWQRDFPELPDWRDTSDQWGLPGYLNTIGQRANDVRNQHLMCCLSSLHDAGERVLAVAGSSHAVCINDALNRRN